jgi:hypothetical protein
MPSGYEKSPDYGDPPKNPRQRLLWVILALCVIAFYYWLIW